MSKKSPATLSWSIVQNGYSWQESEETKPILWQKEDAPWFAWLVNHHSFSFHGQNGNLNLLKEERTRGHEGYWYAYRYRDTRTRKKYAGRSSDLNFAHLENLARALATSEKKANENVKREVSVPARTVSQAQESLLMTKLRPPQIQASLLVRKRLFHALELGLEQKLTLICAPAGFGKTTLLSTWLANRTQKTPFTWLSLEHFDNDPLRFWRYFIAACQIIEPDVGRDALDLLQTFQMPMVSTHAWEAMLTALLNDLLRLPAPSIIVLEDYQFITVPEIQEGMQFLLEHLSTPVHIFLLTRYEPLLPLVKLRARGELIELGIAQLRFSTEETAQFLAQNLPFHVEQNVMDQLQERTEGWITGLRLVSLALHGQEQASLHGLDLQLMDGMRNHRHLLDYLVSEVLSVQSSEWQLFLLQTTGLGRLTGSLCDAVTGNRGSGEILMKMERAHLFLLPLDSSGVWYRYHALFAEMMQEEARRRLGAEALTNIASKASCWYEENELIADAIESALVAKEYERAARLVLGMLDPHNLLHLREYRAVMRWLAQIPEEILSTDSILCQAYAMVIFFCSPRSPALKSKLEPYLYIAENRLEEQEAWPELGEAYTLHALIVGQLSDTATALECAQKAIHLLPVEENYWRGIALSMLGLEAILRGRYADAQQKMYQVRILSDVAEPLTENTHGKSGYLLLQSYLAIGQGRLKQAHYLLKQILAIVDDDQSDHSSALVALATIAYEWNQIPLAYQYAREASALADDSREAMVQVQAIVIYARVLAVMGESVQAQELLHQKMTHLTEQRWIGEIEACLASLAYHAGDVLAVQYWLTSCQAISQEEKPGDNIRECEALFTARLLMRRGDLEPVFPLLTYWLEDARNQTRQRSQVEILLLMALLFARQQRLSEAREHLSEALMQAQGSGYIRLFLDEGDEIFPLLRSLHEPKCASFVQEILHAGATRPLSSLMSVQNSDELLSKQELRVLRLLVAGQRNAEIANELVVSLNTVKTQVKSIYRKLGVGSRQAASEVARQLQLL